MSSLLFKSIFWKRAPLSRQKNWLTDPNPITKLWLKKFLSSALNFLAVFLSVLTPKQTQIYTLCNVANEMHVIADGQLNSIMHTFACVMHSCWSWSSDKVQCGMSDHSCWDQIKSPVVTDRWTAESDVASLRSSTSKTNMMETGESA